MIVFSYLESIELLSLELLIADEPFTMGPLWGPLGWRRYCLFIPMSWRSIWANDNLLENLRSIAKSHSGVDFPPISVLFLSDYYLWPVALGGIFGGLLEDLGLGTTQRYAFRSVWKCGIARKNNVYIYMIKMMTFLIGKLMINWWTFGLCIAIVCNKPVLKQTDLTILVIHWAVASRHSNVASVRRNLSNVQNPLYPIRYNICPHISPYYTVDGRNPAPVDRSFILGFQPSKVLQDFFHPQYVPLSC